MGKFSDHLSESNRAFIAKQHMYFVATAPLSKEGRINLSPKGLDSFKVISDTQVGYMDLVSSGNETSAHTLENGRITIMFCSYGEKPQILRLYGQGRTILKGTPDWDTYAPHFEIYPSTRQIIIADIELTQSSCGFGVPKYDFKGHREIHFDWANGKGEQGLKEYIRKKNLVSLDGLKTNLGIKEKL